MTAVEFADAFQFNNTYATLPAEFYEEIAPTPVNQPRLLIYNQTLASELRLPALNPNHKHWQIACEIFAGNRLPKGAQPIAQAYAGHQFGHFVPQLGDGRAVLLGEVIDRNQQRRDIQLKGSGPTCFSRSGDGRAPLGAVIREYLISEAMHALGIPTTRSLAIVSTGEPVFRDQVLPGGVLTRIASSHIRVGTFEYFAARGQHHSLRLLADYTLKRHYPELTGHAQPYVELLKAVMHKQCMLVSRWLSVGFIHGVMNTDNMTLSGETIDYGPCAFLDTYHPKTTFSSIDRYGRYCYENQRHIVGWNLACLAQCLLPVLHQKSEYAVELAQSILSELNDTFDHYWLKVMAKKFGIHTPNNTDRHIIENFLNLLQYQQADFTNAFAALVLCQDTLQFDALKPFIGDSTQALQWLEKWQTRLKERTQISSKQEIISTLRQANPIYIARNHQVEKAIRTVEQENKLDEMNILLTVLQNPFTTNPNWQAFTEPPADHERVLHTFCGT